MIYFEDTSFSNHLENKSQPRYQGVYEDERFSNKVQNASETTYKICVGGNTARKVFLVDKSSNNVPFTRKRPRDYEFDEDDELPSKKPYVGPDFASKGLIEDDVVREVYFVRELSTDSLETEDQTPENDESPLFKVSINPEFTFEKSTRKTSIGDVFFAKKSPLNGSNQSIAIKVIPYANLFDPLTKKWQWKTYNAIVKDIIMTGELLNHSNCAVGLYGIHEDHYNIYLEMEYISFGSLDRLIKEKYPFSFESLQTITLEMCKGVAEMHKYKIFHGALEPKNFLIGDNWKVKIVGFREAMILRGESNVPQEWGSLPYWSPERFDGKPANFSMNIWSLGVVIYELATGELPFGTEGKASEAEILELKKRVKNHRIDLVPIYNVCPRLVGVILAALYIIPNERPSADKLQRYWWFRLTSKEFEEIQKCDPSQDFITTTPQHPPPKPHQVDMKNCESSRFPEIEPPSDPGSSLKRNPQLRRSKVPIGQGPLD